MFEEKGTISFLGREFLTWLWFKSEERNGTVHLPDTGDVFIQFQKRIVLESGEGEYAETVSCQGFHADLAEGKAALREGKKVREARITLGVGSQEWEFTFKADQFQFQSMKLPKTMPLSEEEQDLEPRLLERISLVEEPVQAMQRLFEQFLSKRLGSAWIDEELPSLRKWMQT
ncbi:MAG: hypothetical protein HY788_05245 [Deltaproteobacteria bacterium]|nr:hypothetical protein [Deltaproteobacteria bacterium]